MQAISNKSPCQDKKYTGKKRGVIADDGLNFSLDFDLLDCCVHQYWNEQTLDQQHYHKEKVRSGVHKESFMMFQEKWCQGNDNTLKGHNLDQSHESV